MQILTNYVNSIVTKDTPYTNANEELQKIRNLLLTAQESVTFWGDRRIQVNGYQGFVSIDVIVTKLYEVVGWRKFVQLNLSQDEKEMLRKENNETRDYVPFTPQERIAGFEAATELKTIYYNADGQMKFLTKIISKIREFISNWHFSSGSILPKYNNHNLRWTIDSDDLATSCLTFSPEEFCQAIPLNGEERPTQNVIVQYATIAKLIP